MKEVGIFYGHWAYLRPCDTFYGLLVYFVIIWYIFPRFGTLYREKSGNPDGRSTMGRNKKHSGCKRRLLELLSQWATRKCQKVFFCFQSEPLHIHRVTRGRCYDHDFLRFFPIFGEKIGVFLENQCYDQFFFQNLALFWVKNAHFFAKFFGENI
jgi:hypothetical protein